MFLKLSIPHFQAFSSARNALLLTPTPDFPQSVILFILLKRHLLDNLQDYPTSHYPRSQCLPLIKQSSPPSGLQGTGGHVPLSTIFLTAMPSRFPGHRKGSEKVSLNE